MKRQDKAIIAFVKALTPQVTPAGSTLSDGVKSLADDEASRCKRCRRTMEELKRSHPDREYHWHCIEGQRYCPACYSALRRAIIKGKPAPVKDYHSNFPVRKDPTGPMQWLLSEIDDKHDNHA